MQEMKRECGVLLHLLNKSLHPETENLPEEVLGDVDWNAVMEEASHQTVLLSAFDAAANYKSLIPDEVYRTWFQRVSRGLISNLRVNEAQRELTHLLEKKEFPYVILKGEASASYYSRPELRQLGDVDFLIDPAQKDAVERELTKAGYTSSGHGHAVHVVFKKAGAHLEMHFTLPGVPGGQQGVLVQRFVQDILRLPKATERIKVQGYMPIEPHHGLVLLLHMQQHMLSEGLGLRHLCDWAAFVDRTYEKAFWTEALLPLLKEIGLLKYTAVMTKLCAYALGSVCPEWADAEVELCQAVLGDILNGGNFGRKDKTRSQAGIMITGRTQNGIAKSRAHVLFKTLHQSVQKKHPIVKQVKVLHPAFDIYHGVLYILRSMMGKRPSLIKLAPLAQERRAIYEQLEIFETEKTDEA